jgi:hypothetical protein
MDSTAFWWWNRAVLSASGEERSQAGFGLIRTLPCSGCGSFEQDAGSESRRTQSGCDAQLEDTGIRRMVVWEKEQ